MPDKHYTDDVWKAREEFERGVEAKVEQFEDHAPQDDK